MAGQGGEFCAPSLLFSGLGRMAEPQRVPAVLSYFLLLTKKSRADPLRRFVRGFCYPICGIPLDHPSITKGE